jgi:hypothetical protein
VSFSFVHSSIQEKTIRGEASLITMDVKNEEETTVASSEEPKEEEEEQMNIEKLESDSEKEKHDVSSKSETEITDNEIDAQPVILEGKRSRKPTLRLEISELVPAKKEFSIPQVSLTLRLYSHEKSWIHSYL